MPELTAWPIPGMKLTPRIGLTRLTRCRCAPTPSAPAAWRRNLPSQVARLRSLWTTAQTLLAFAARPGAEFQRHTSVVNSWSCGRAGSQDECQSSMVESPGLERVRD